MTLDIPDDLLMEIRTALRAHADKTWMRLEIEIAKKEAYETAVNGLFTKGQLLRRLGVDGVTPEDFGEKTCIHCGAPSMHESYLPGGRVETLYCACYVATGRPPADWHPECMRAARKEQE